MLELEFRSLMDEEVIQKASLDNRAFAFSQLFNALRLATHQSTENVGILGKVILQAEENLGAGKTTSGSGGKLHTLQEPGSY